MIRVGLYCGSKLVRIRYRRDYGGFFCHWKQYGLFRKVPDGFSIGPILFWKE